MVKAIRKRAVLHFTRWTNVPNLGGLRCKKRKLPKKKEPPNNGGSDGAGDLFLAETNSLSPHSSNSVIIRTSDLKKNRVNGSKSF